MWQAIKKFFKDCMTEKDNQTFCVIRAGGFLGVFVVILGTVYGIIHYGIVAGSVFDPGKVCDTLKSFVEELAGLMGGTSLSIKGKQSADATPGA